MAFLPCALSNRSYMKAGRKWHETSQKVFMKRDSVNEKFGYHITYLSKNR